MKHSNVYYKYDSHKENFTPLEKATRYKNNHGLDLFKHNGFVYEGRTGVRLISESMFTAFDSKLESIGGVEEFNKRIEKQLEITGESPRYSRPNELKKEVFPPNPKNETLKLTKDTQGHKHYYNRFEYMGYEFFTRSTDKGDYRQVYVQCEEYMLGIGSHHNLAFIVERLDGFENGVKGEVERQFSESMADPNKWADIGFANILGRLDEANAHNILILEARELERERRDAEHIAKCEADMQAEREEYSQAIRSAEEKILKKQTVLNSDIQDKSLVMQLFREHDISVPLKTQGWIIKSLHSLEYDVKRDEWSYRYYKSSKNSTVFFDYLNRLVSAVQTKQQFEENSQSSDDSRYYDNSAENEDEDDMEI